jgi:hypothetical protein
MVSGQDRPGRRGPVNRLLRDVALVVLTGHLVPRDPLSIADLARILGLPKSTLHERVASARLRVGSILFLHAADGTSSEEPEQERQQRMARNLQRRRNRPRRANAADD